MLIVILPHRRFEPVRTAAAVYLHSDDLDVRFPATRFRRRNFRVSDEPAPTRPSAPASRSGEDERGYRNSSKSRSPPTSALAENTIRRRSGETLNPRPSPGTGGATSIDFCKR